MDGGEFLQGSRAPEPENCTHSKAEWEMRVLCPIVQPATGLRLVGCTKLPQGGPLGAPFICDELLRPTLSQHCFLRHFNAGVLSRFFVT